MLSYRETLDFLYGLQRFGIKLGLTNIRSLLERLGHPEKSCQIVHVAGTNGKGSVCAGVAGLLQAAGRRTGLYTSPHLHAFGERIRVNGECIPEAEVVRLTRELRALSSDIPATFFEFTTALALRYFQERQVEWAVLEVGMGGRLDATNTVCPRVTVITPVSLDHAEHLGSDLAAIAREKGGIIKPGVPLILGPQAPRAAREIEALARAVGAPVQKFGRDFSVTLAGDQFDFRGRRFFLPGLSPRLAGAHQRENLSLALAVAEELQPLVPELNEAILRRSIAQVTWPGRLEWFPGRPSVLLDGAHNPAGAAALAAHLAGLDLGALPWIIGLSGDRRPGEILAPWLPHMAAAYVVEPRADKVVPAREIAAFLQGRGKPVYLFASPEAALIAATGEWPQAPLVVTAGSLYLAADVRRQLLSQEEFKL